MADEHEIREPTAQDYVVKNRIQQSDEAIHGWYRFVLGYPPHLVREYLVSLQTDPERDLIFDPFCGTATTPLEARLQGYATIGADANPISVLAGRVKLNWNINLFQVQAILDDVIEISSSCMKKIGLSPTPESDYQLSFFGPQVHTESRSSGDEVVSGFDPVKLLLAESEALIPSGFISRNPLLRVLALRYAIESIYVQQEIKDFLMLALASTIVKSASNIGFGPEVYRLPPLIDTDVLGAYINTVVRMITDLQTVLDKKPARFSRTAIFRADARTLNPLSDYSQIGAVITSPPYPNEKDYTRSTRLESVLLGFITSKADLRTLKKDLLRSNTRNVFVGDDDDKYVADIESITKVADEIENTRLRLGKTSGFERLYHRVTRLYFGGMYLHLKTLRPYLRSGAYCAYVVGDQMSYFRVHIRTAELLADVAMKAGYLVEGIELWRTRRSTTTGLSLNENVLILRRPE